MADVTMQGIEFQIINDSGAASNSLETLANNLNKLKSSLNGSSSSLNKTAAGLNSIKTALSHMNTGNFESQLQRISRGLEALNQKTQGLKISSSIGNQLEEIGTALNGLPDSASAKLQDLATGLQPLSELGKANLTTFINQLNKLPDVATKLDAVDMGKFTQQIQSLATALKPLADEMNKVAAGFSAFPSKIQKLITNTKQYESTVAKTSATTNNLNSSMLTLTEGLNKLYRSFSNLYVYRIMYRAMASMISKSNDYVEMLNMFTVSLGDYSESAYTYAQKVSEALGIDPAEWMQAQGTINSIITGFGVAADRAEIMSQNLTQLAYDLASLYNISASDAVTKVQSGIAGELEPLRRLGFDISIARLEQERLALGLSKSVSEMNQAEKSQLRYYAMLTQVTHAQGDMARTLDAPANQLRILKAQLTQAARAIGNLFIPALKAILPPLIAIVKVFREVIEYAGTLFGYTVQKIDWDTAADSTGIISDELDNATQSAKEMKAYLAGFDELNVLPSTTDSGTGDYSDSSFQIDLPTYDFLKDAVETNINQLVDSMKPIKEALNDIVDYLHEYKNLVMAGLGFIALTRLFKLLKKLWAWMLGKKLVTSVVSGFDVMYTSGEGVLAGLKSGFSALKTHIATARDEMGGFKKAAIVAVAAVAEFSVLKSVFKDIREAGSATAGQIVEIGVVAGVAAIAMYAAFGPAGIAVAALVALGAAIVSATEAQVEMYYEMSKTEYYENNGIAIDGVRTSLQNYFNSLDFDKQSKWVDLIKSSEEAYTDANEAYYDLWESMSDKDVWGTDEIDALRDSFNDLAKSAKNLNAARIDSVMKSIKTGIEVNITDKLSGKLGGLIDKLEAAQALLGAKISGLSDEYNQLLDDIAAGGGNPTAAQKQKLSQLKSDLSSFTLSEDASTERWKIEIEEAKNSAINAGDNMDAVLKNVEDLMSDRDNYLNSIKEKYATDMNSIQQLIDLDRTQFGGKLGFVASDLTDLKEAYNAQISAVNKKYNEVLQQIIATYENTMLRGDWAWFTDSFAGNIMYGFGSLINDENIIYNYSQGKLQKEQMELLEKLKKYYIQGYASGGFPEQGQMFIANEAGPELVGQIGRKTAVANQSQITDGIAQGVYQAVTAANSNGNSNNNRPIVVNITLDRRTIGQAVVDYAHSETVRTGYNPLFEY